MVVDAAGRDRFSTLGISRRGPIAIAYAVKHPERVTHLVLHGAFAPGLNHLGTRRQLEARPALVSLMRLGCGLNNPAFCKMFTCRFNPRPRPSMSSGSMNSGAVDVAGNAGAANGARRQTSTPDHSCRR
jgi:pimeloyl-ACP methyl ester carboxylesterase